jgi:hypothetical protein
MAKKSDTDPSSATATPAGAFKPKLYDADDANPSFARFYPQVEQLLLTGKGLEPLFNWLEAPEEVAIVDFGARATRSLVEFDDNTGFFQAAAKYKTKVVVCYTLAPEEDSIGLLKELSAKLGSSVTWLVARSTFKIGTWEVWEASNTRKTLAEMGASEMLAPTLDADAWAGLGKHSLTAVVGAEDKRLTLVVRSYVFRWRQKYAAEFEDAVRPLLNPNGKTLFFVTGEKGGVGKSSFARALTDWFLNPQAVPVA